MIYDMYNHLKLLKSNNERLYSLFDLLIKNGIIIDFYQTEKAFDLYPWQKHIEYYLSRNDPKHLIVIKFDNSNMTRIYTIDHYEVENEISKLQLAEWLLTIPSIKHKMPYYLDLFI